MPTPPMHTEAGHLFTPFLDDDATAPGETLDDGRAVMRLDDTDQAAFDALPHGESDTVVTVTDQATGTRWHAARSSCGFGCYCAALTFPA